MSDEFQEFQDLLKAFSNDEIARMLDMVFTGSQYTNEDRIRDLILHARKLDPPAISLVSSHRITNPAALNVLVRLNNSELKEALVVYHWSELSDEQQDYLIQFGSDSVRRAIVMHHVDQLSLEQFKELLKQKGDFNIGALTYTRGMTEEAKGAFEEGLEVGSPQYISLSNGDFSSVAALSDDQLADMRVLPRYSEVSFSDLGRALK